MSYELILAKDGVVIGDRDKNFAINLSYGNMFKIVHQFLNEFYKYDAITQYGDKLRLQRLKEGNGSPYPIIVTGTTINGRTIEKQLRPEDIIGISKFEEEKNRE